VTNNRRLNCTNDKKKPSQKGGFFFDFSLVNMFCPQAGQAFITATRQRPVLRLLTFTRFSDIGPALVKAAYAMIGVFIKLALL
jgi:hypothetical protein